MEFNAVTGLEEQASTTKNNGVAAHVLPSTTVPMRQQRKEGGNCCGFCCDYRRAVIIMNTISIILAVLGFATPSNRTDNQIEDDDLSEKVEDIRDNYATPLLIVGIVGLVTTCLSLYGAVSFNWQLVAVNVLYAVINLIVVIVYSTQSTSEILDLIEEEKLIDDDTIDTEKLVRYGAVVSYILVGLITFLWVYPSIFFVVECKRGTMTKETYPREEFSCCCTPPRRH
jgi:hypothetical protein